MEALSFPSTIKGVPIRFNIAKLVFFIIVLSFVLSKCLTVSVNADEAFTIGTTASFPDVESKKAVTMRFVEDFAGIDTEAYDSVGCSVSNFTDPIGTVPHLITDVMFTLLKDNLKTQVGVMFLDDKFYYFNVQSHRLYGTYAEPVSPLLKERTSHDPINVVRDALSTYEALVNATYIDSFAPLLDRVTTSNAPQRISANNTVLDIIKLSLDAATYMTFNYTLNELPSRWLTIVIGTSASGYVTAFGDGLSVFRIGNTVVSIAENEALRIALENASQYIDSIGAKIVKTETELCLQRGKGGDEFILFPYWHIRFTFDKIYPMNIVGYYVGIWADTGEIGHSQPQGFYIEPQGNGAFPAWFVLPPFCVAIALVTIAYAKRKTKQQRSPPVISTAT